MTRIKILKYIKKLKEEDIARRYFVMNSFDGALTMLGIIVGMYLAYSRNLLDASDSGLVIISCIGAAIALGVSGVWSAYASERAERMHNFRQLEMYMLSDLKGTEIEKNMKLVVVLIAMVNGLSPFLVSVLVISPFVLLPIPGAFYAAMLIVFSVLFLLGVFVARVSEENIIKSGFKMVSAGILIGILLLIIDGFKVI